LLNEGRRSSRRRGSRASARQRQSRWLSRLQGATIVITEQVQFRAASDAILPASDELLNSVNSVFRARA
jgi:hypothetical protein